MKFLNGTTRSLENHAYCSPYAVVGVCLSVCPLSSYLTLSNIVTLKSG